MKKLLHRVWAEINLDALGNNIREIKEYTKNKDIMAVVKANAYGHGVGLIAPELFRLGINKFCVSNMGEAKELRDLLPKADILIFGGNEEEWFSDIVNLNLIQTVGDTEFAKTLSDFAVKNNVTIRVHIKVDTGMSRIGIESKEELQEITALKGLKIEGVYTHFACSDSLCENEIVFTK
ncbi:MAG: alanine racemase, partial [Ruminiclostridium sp.]|nr:alanine racemase [Ruminiclostridium sp.]